MSSIVRIADICTGAWLLPFPSSSFPPSSLPSHCLAPSLRRLTTTTYPGCLIRRALNMDAGRNFVRRRTLQGGSSHWLVPSPLASWLWREATSLRSCTFVAGGGRDAEAVRAVWLMRCSWESGQRVGGSTRGSPRCGQDQGACAASPPLVLRPRPPSFLRPYESWPRLPRQHQHLLQSTLPHSPCSSARSRRSSHLLAPSECRTGPLPSKP